MHSEFRRLPVERAWHAKRLGHLEAVLVTTSQTPTTTLTSTPTSPTSQQKTTSELSSSSPTTKSQQTLTSSVSSPTSTLTTSSSTTSSKTTLSTSSLAPTSPLNHSTTAQSVVPITASPSPTTNTINAPVNAVSTQGLSGGAIGGIIAASVIASIALVILFVRKTYLRRRQKRRISWPAGNVFNEIKPLPAVPAQNLSTKPPSFRNSPMSPFEAHRPPKYPSPQRTQSPFTGYAAPAPPAPSYNNPISMYSQLAPSLSRRNSDLAVALPNAPQDVNVPRFPTVTQALVKCAFIPTLPDELSVTAGQRICVLAQYDDGWDLCANDRGEQGMVPQECLDHPISSDQGDWRNARRTSSLSPDGRRF